MAEREEPRVPGPRDHQRDTERRSAALYQAYYRPILAYAVRRVAPGEDAADAAADVFTTAWRRTVLQDTEYLRAGVVNSDTAIPR